MKVRIPDIVGRAWDAWEAWVNVPVWSRGDGSDNGGERLEVRRIDVLLAIGFIGCVSWYAYTTGWQGALMGGVMYLVVAAMALWLL
jgi:hypothetical protein